MAKYISRDDISEFADYNKPDESDYFGTGIAERMRLDAIKELCEELDKLPLVEIEEEPIKHGRWIDDGTNTVCSVCGEALPTITANATTWDDWDYLYPDVYEIEETSFCPNCGAKMDEDVPTDLHNVCPCG